MLQGKVSVYLLSIHYIYLSIPIAMTAVMLWPLAVRSWLSACCACSIIRSNRSSLYVFRQRTRPVQIRSALPCQCVIVKLFSLWAGSPADVNNKSAVSTLSTFGSFTFSYILYQGRDDWGLERPFAVIKHAVRRGEDARSIPGRTKTSFAISVYARWEANVVQQYSQCCDPYGCCSVFTCSYRQSSLVAALGPRALLGC